MEEAFCLLKTRFSTHPILVQPDHRRQFVVEVDASETGVGAVLSQQAEDRKLYPCAFFSRRLTAAERNYDVGDRELLAGKLALDEWRHWLEGAEHPFVIWTDHKNLAYIQDAKRLNSWQARWQLIFNRFHFSLTYRPGYRYRMPYLDNMCARGKALHRPLAGLLRLLLIPTRPWSHIALDFVTVLPESRGCTTILTIVDRFSKAVHFVPLTKLRQPWRPHNY